MENLIDRGPLFKYTQDYNLNSIVSCNFHWTNLMPATFIDIKNIKTYSIQHYEHVLITKSLTYKEILEIILTYTPKIIYITKKIKDPHTIPNIEFDMLKAKNLSCFIYLFDLRLDFVHKYFPNVKYIYADEVSFGSGSVSGASPSPAAAAANINFALLEILSVNVVTNAALNVKAPRLKELNLYKWYEDHDENTETTTTTTTTTDQTEKKQKENKISKKTNKQILLKKLPPYIDIDNYQFLSVIRLDDRIKLIFNNNNNTITNSHLNSIQFFYFIPEKYQSKSGVLINLKPLTGNHDPSYYKSILKKFKPKEIIIPPNVFNKSDIDDISSMNAIQNIGLYIGDNYINLYLEKFKNAIEIFDYYNIHAAMCLRYDSDATKYFSRTYESLAVGAQDIVYGSQTILKDNQNNIIEPTTPSITSNSTDKNNIICLTNFDLTNPNYNARWMYLFTMIEKEFKLKPIIITRCEIVKPIKEFSWPSLVTAIKKQITIINLQKQSLFLDISNITTKSLIDNLDRINGSFPFKSIVIITHGMNISKENIAYIKDRYGGINITAYDMPYVIYT